MPDVSILKFPVKNETIAMIGIKIASRIEPTAMPTFLSAFGFVSMDTATFFKAAPTVAPIKIPPNRKAPTDLACRLVLYFNVFDCCVISALISCALFLYIILFTKFMIRWFISGAGNQFDFLAFFSLLCTSY